MRCHGRKRPRSIGSRAKGRTLRAHRAARTTAGPAGRRHPQRPNRIPQCVGKRVPAVADDSRPPRGSEDSRCSRSPRGFTLVEALVALAVATIAGTALLTAVANSVQSSSMLLRRTIGLGLAQQMLDEIAACAFPVYPDGYQPAAPRTATDRLEFDDIDDYDGWKSRPPVDRAGRALGTAGTDQGGTYVPRPNSMLANPLLIERYERSVRVEFVEPVGDGEWQVRTKPTDWRRVTVTIRHTDLSGRTQTVATLAEVFARIPQ
ncbi:MAG: type II secretion system protein [Planctomycetota bacterium]|nr:MAG: type II secretion system protein [Planctomycetota bacterium]